MLYVHGIEAVILSFLRFEYPKENIPLFYQV